MISITRRPSIEEERRLAFLPHVGLTAIALLLVVWPSEIAPVDPWVPVLELQGAPVAPPTLRDFGIRPADARRRITAGRFADALYPPEGVYWVGEKKGVREIRMGVRDHTTAGGPHAEDDVQAVSSEPFRIEVEARAGRNAGKVRTFVLAPSVSSPEPDIVGECAGLRGMAGGESVVRGWGAQVTSGFDPARRHPVTGLQEPHNGVDIGAALGAAISPVLPGRVVAVGPARGFGTRVVISHGHGLESLYGHMLYARAHPGDSVSIRDTIGTVGWSGNATGPHLHLELTRDDVPFDPCEPQVGQSLAGGTPANP